MFGFLKENLIVQLIFIAVIGLALYFLGPWIWEQLTGIFGTYEENFSPLRYRY